MGVDNISHEAYVGNAYMEGVLGYHHGNLREALLERAAAIIAADGVEAVSLRGLARDLGVSHSAPSRHFADRASLLSALAVEGLAKSVAAMRAGAQAAGSDPIARYRALGRSYVAFARSDPSYFAAITHPEVVAQSGRELREARDAWFDVLRDGVAAAQAAGWYPELPVEVLVAFSTSAALGAAQILSDANYTKALGVDDVDAMADAVLEITVSETSALRLPEPGPPGDERAGGSPT